MTCGLRDYGTATWESGKNGCDHIKPDRQGENGERANRTTGHDDIYKDLCKKCGAKRIDSQLGLEKTPEGFIENCVIWAREVWRVLRDDGTFWLNLGDTYYNYRGASDYQSKQTIAKHSGHEMQSASGKRNHKQDNLKGKDLVGIPWLVALALRNDGWYLRSAMPWVKRSAMPESCTDRPASALEYMFLLTKSSKYYFDMDAIRKPNSPETQEYFNKYKAKEYKNKTERSEMLGKYGATRVGASSRAEVASRLNPAGRNFRNTDLFYQSLEEPHGAIFAGEEMVGLDVNPQAYSEAHFATFPEKLVEPCIKAGTSEVGRCPECSAPWERVVEKLVPETRNVISEYPGKNTCSTKKYKNDTGPTSKTIGWESTCKCGHKETVPCIVLDPFGGSGTTKNVADRLGRRGVMTELKTEYIEMAKKRCYQLPELFRQ